MVLVLRGICARSVGGYYDDYSMAESARIEMENESEVDALFAEWWRGNYREGLTGLEAIQSAFHAGWEARGNIIEILGGKDE